MKIAASSGSTTAGPAEPWKPGQPGQPLGIAADIFAHMLVGQRHDEAVEAVGLQLLAEGGEAVGIGWTFRHHLFCKGATAIGPFLACFCAGRDGSALLDGNDEQSPIPRHRPAAARRAASAQLQRHGVTIEDPWAWLRDPGYPDVQDEDVLAYLKAENAYFEAAMAPHKALTDSCSRR